jgi:hypothetical protein
LRFARVVACALACVRADGGEEKPPVPLYTNEDLRRVRPLRAQTGVLSTPAVAPDPPAPAGAADKSREERYWRGEAERLADRLRPLHARAADLKRRIEERRSKPGVRTLSDPQIRGWERDVDEVVATVRQLESRLEERARRAGALPGWLR